MLGKPKYKKGDIVKFDIIPFNSDESIECEGYIFIVDKWGIFGYDDDVYYDIMVEDYNNTGERMLVKHIKESDIK